MGLDITGDGYWFFCFHEPASLLRLGSLPLIFLGCIGLRLS